MSGHTLKLSPRTWDLTLDAAGRMVTTDRDYGIAQNVACAVRLFTKDAFYDPDKGVPHFITELGFLPDSSLVRSRIRDAALTVEGVASAQVSDIVIRDRVLHGEIEITTSDGENINVEF